MGSLATFKSTYVSSGVLNKGGSEQLAGPVQALEQQVARGLTHAQAVTNISTKRTRRVLYKAQRDASPEQAAMVSDFYAIDAA